MNEKIKAVFDWFVFSSSNPEKLGLTIKSLLAFAVLFGFDNTLVDETSNAILSVIVAIGMLLTALSGGWGITRKVYKTVQNRLS